MSHLRKLIVTAIGCGFVAGATFVVEPYRPAHEEKSPTTTHAAQDQATGGDARVSGEAGQVTSRQRFEPPWRYRPDQTARSDRDRGPDRGGRSRGFEVTPESRERVLAVLRDLRPSLTEDDLARLRSMSVDDFKSLMIERAGNILYLARLRESVPELYEIKVEELKVDVLVQAEAGRYRMALDKGDASAAEAARKRLETVVTHQYDLRLASRELELRLFESRLEDMRRDLARERDEKQARVDQWLEDIREGRIHGGPNNDARPDGGPAHRDRNNPPRP